MRIHFQLNGTFSYFPHRSPSHTEVDHLDVLFLTPDASSWQPHDTHYSIEENSYVDTEGLFIERPKKLPKYLLTDEDDAITGAILGANGEAGNP